MHMDASAMRNLRQMAACSRQAGPPPVALVLAGPEAVGREAAGSPYQPPQATDEKLAEFLTYVEE